MSSRADSGDAPAGELSNAAHNAFAAGLVDRIVERALGRDASSARLVGTRPSDHVLAGFLTPLSRPSAVVGEDAQSAEADDLPQDSAYEQTAIGIEWLAPIEGLSGGTIEIEAQISVYTRRLPTLPEQMKHVRFRQSPEQSHAPASSSAEDRTRLAPLTPVWARHDAAPLVVSIPCAAILQRKVITEGLAAELQAALTPEGLAGSYADIGPYPSASELAAPEAVLHPDHYPRWASSHAAKRANGAGRSIGLAGWAPRVDLRAVRAPTMPGCMRLTALLVNASPPRAGRALDYIDPNLYAVRLRLRIPAAAHAMMEFADLPRSYRYDRTIYGVGVNADVEVETRADPTTRTLCTATLPRHSVARLTPREIPNATPTFAALVDDPIPLLRRIAVAMERYDAEQWGSCLDRLRAEKRDGAVAEARRDRERFTHDEIATFVRGVDLLEQAREADSRYAWVARAFALMNEAMGAYAAGKYDRWRLFQIVFIVVQIAELAGRVYPELREPRDDDVAVLWFAAGGGKTEAFLGLLLWQLFFDRLRGKTVGVSAFIRFPLRLLTFQQLQRTARALAQADQLRERERLAGERFCLGYFVGGRGATPNSINDDRHARFRDPDHGPDEIMRTLKRCPFCNAQVTLQYKPDLRIVEHWCVEAKGACPNGDRRLPIYVVDADIYRFLPSVVVSTIDKLALIGQNPRFALLLGRVHVYCGKHGASFLNSNDACGAAKTYAQRALMGDENPRAPTLSSLCQGFQVSYGPFHDPAPTLVIQDELHLLSEDIGTFDAHYETAALQLLRSFGSKPWKIIAATATIERFDRHAFHLYLRQARQFPAPGPEAFSSFYYHLDQTSIGRIFVGVLGVGRKHTPSLSRLLSLIYQELQTAREAAAEDLERACARYQLPQLTRAALKLLIYRYELALTYVLTLKGSDQVTEALRSRVSEEVRSLMPSHGTLRLQTFNSSVEQSEMQDIMDSIEAEDEAGDPAERVRGVVATNIISHGVDINRFNIIAFGGFPRMVAEYIQASARVGRTFPGVSFFVVTPQSERDRSLFERFTAFHTYLDRLIDPAAINRWPLQALERTIPGLLAAYLTMVAADAIGSPLTWVGTIGERAGAGASGSLAQEQIVTWMQEALGAAQAPDPERYAHEVGVITRRRYAELINAAPETRGMQVRMALDPMRSLRDIDAPAEIQVWNRDDRAIIRHLARP